ncbi:MAG: 4-alpha-glucanotransferase [Planctomycetes bacterium]|nr:4-alpha-glucanotransferase [Planctomycetota bacterium]
MKRRFRLSERACGVLLHPTSLPGPHGSGDLGPQAYRFVDFLAAAGQRWWQMLPNHPPGPGNSPYSSYSALAGSPLLISLDKLAEDGLLDADDIGPTARGLRRDRVAYEAVARFRMECLRRASERFAARGGFRRAAFRHFCETKRPWLADYACYCALKRAHRGQPWTGWQRDLRLRRTAALRQACEQLRHEIEFEQFVQFQFHRQWAALRSYAHAHGVGLIGDVPIFVAHDSSDVWTHRALFQLDADGRPTVVSGCPPDAFNRNGQLWGHPHYRWARHRQTGFDWWLARFRRAFEQFDAVRIDHFLGFYRCWAVPARARTARHGRWVRTPGKALFQALRRKLGRVEILAEDLGAVTPQALALRDRFDFPGLRVLQFAFGDDEGCRYHQPHSYPRRAVVYSGTHDSDTTRGWFRHAKVAARKRRRGEDVGEYRRALRYLGSDGRAVHWDMIRLAYSSVADTAIVPLQDVLGLGSRHRMNIPGTSTGNWEWRMPEAVLTTLAVRLRDLAVAYGRTVVDRPGKHT